MNQLRIQREQTGTSGGVARMWVDYELCDPCDDSGGIGSMLRGAGLDSVEVIYPGGSKVFTAQSRTGIAR
jgi:hypothetical protein